MLDLTQFKVISFDCYGTLIDWETGIFSALRPILAAHKKTLSDAQLLALYSELESEAEQGEFRTYREVLKSVVRGYGRRLEFKPTEAEEESLPASLANWKPFPDTVAALRKLKARFQLAVISNVDDDLFAATARRLEVPFDHLITAQQARAYKPSLKVFNLARQTNRHSPGGLAACRAKHLSRRSSGEVPGDFDGVGKPSVATSRSRSGQIRYCRPRSCCAEPGNPRTDR